jgi:hypothetical protein
MGAIHEDKTYALKIRESANDGSDFTNPEADYRIFFLGEDGEFHLKDSAGSVTDPGGASAVTAHTGDTSDAHDASAISVLDTAANFTGTDVEAVLAELQDNIDAGGSGIAPTIFDAEGDLIIASAADTAARLARGTDGYALVSTSSTVAWEAQYTTLNFIIDGGGSAITTGVKGYIEVPFSAVIVAVTTLLDQSGSIVVDIWRDSYANFPPLDADSITASAPPTVSAATKSTDSTLTGWTTSITANDVLAFNVDSATTTTRATIALRLRRT